MYTAWRYPSILLGNKTTSSGLTKKWPGFARRAFPLKHVRRLEDQPDRQLNLSWITNALTKKPVKIE